MAYISLKNIELEFPVYDNLSFSLRHTIVKTATGGILKKKQKSNNYTVAALKNITFTLNKGDRLGLIGHNGSGKTTLLKVLAGIYAPTYGKLEIKGKISTLFDVLLGTYDDVTGYENLYLSSLIRGKTIKEAKKSLELMAKFTELGDYLNMPMRTYSNGMKLRVGFSAATDSTPDILLIDEIFGTGDQNFVEKSRERLQSLIKNTGILVFSSHSEELIKNFCNKVLVLEKGEIKFFGEVDTVLEEYRKDSKK